MRHTCSTLWIQRDNDIDANVCAGSVAAAEVMLVMDDGTVSLLEKTAYVCARVFVCQLHVYWHHQPHTIELL